MRGKFILAFSLLSSVLFLFSSCGMPTYHDFDHFSNAIQVSTSSVPGIETDYLAVYRVIINDVDPYLSQIDDSSPAVLLMYSIAPSGSSSIGTQFNSVYRGSSRYNNGMQVVFDNDGSLENISYTDTDENKEIKVYRFSDENGNPLSISPYYTYSNLDLNTYYYFAIRKEYYSSDSSEFVFVMDVYRRSNTSSNVSDEERNPIAEVVLRRANGSLFYSQSSGSGDYSFYEAGTVRYTINLYLTVNLTPGSNAEFSNLYWSRLYNSRFVVE